MKTLVLVALVFFSTSVRAEIWRVEIDGSGDFTNLQSAVDAASDDDVIEIGPGHFSDNPAGHWAVVVIENKSLAIRGAGRGQTLLGPIDPPTDDSPIGWAGIVQESSGGAHTLAVSDLSLVNIPGPAIAGSHGGALFVERVTVRQSHVAVQAGAGGLLRDCRVEDCRYPVEYGSGGLELWSARAWLVESCEFIRCGLAISVTGGPLDALEDGGVTIRECHFEDCRLAALVGEEGRVEWRDNRVLGGEDGLAFSDRARRAIVTDSVVEVTGLGLRFGLDGGGGPDVATVIDVTRVQVSAATAGLRFEQVEAGLSFEGNHVVRSVEGAWLVDMPPAAPGTAVVVQLLAGNWWGSADTDSVDAWILDADDSGEGEFEDHYAVDVVFLPLLERPTTTHRTSFSELRQLFRGR